MRKLVYWVCDQLGIVYVTSKAYQSDARGDRFEVYLSDGSAYLTPWVKFVK